MPPELRLEGLSVGSHRPSSDANFRECFLPVAGPTDASRSQRSSLSRRSSMRSRRSSMRAKCSLILCLNSCSGIASPGSLGSPERSSKSPPRSRLCRSRSCPLRPCPPPLACLSLSLPTCPSSLFSTDLVAISICKACTRKRAKVGSDTSTTAESFVKTKLAGRSFYALKWIPLSCHFLSYSILRKSPVPAAQLVGPRYLRRARRPRSRQLLACPDRHVHRSAQRLPPYLS